jgi:hypothetical protein
MNTNERSMAMATSITLNAENRSNKCKDNDHQGCNELRAFGHPCECPCHYFDDKEAKQKIKDMKANKPVVVN